MRSLMADTKARMQRLRARRKQHGERSIDVWLDPESHQRLLRLSDLSGGTFNQVIRRALLALEAQGHAATPLTSPDALSDAPHRPPGALSDAADRALVPPLSDLSDEPHHAVRVTPELNPLQR